MIKLSPQIQCLIRYFAHEQLRLILKNASKFIAFWSLLMSVTSAFAQKDLSDEMIIFAGKNYKVQYPKSWTLDTSRAMGPAVFIFSPLENGEDKFRENVNVLIQNLKGEDINLARYKEITDKQVIDLATDGEIFESAITRKNNQEYYRISYAMTQGKFRVRITSVCFIQNEEAYLVTFSSEIDKYDTYKKTGNQILASFKLTR